MTDERDSALEERDAVRNDLSENISSVCFFLGGYKIDLACMRIKRAKEGNKQLNFSVKKKPKATAYVLHISSIFYD